MSDRDLLNASRRGDAGEVERLISLKADVNFEVCSRLAAAAMFFLSVGRCRYATHSLRIGGVV